MAKPATHDAYVDLAQRLLIESLARAAAEQRHGTIEIHVTFHAGEIIRVQESHVATHKI